MMANYVFGIRSVPCSFLRKVVKQKLSVQEDVTLQKYESALTKCRICVYISSSELHATFSQPYYILNFFSHYTGCCSAHDP